MYTYFFIRLTLLAVRFLFFFYSYADPRDLHSFPTRRSSDLHAVAGRGGDNGWDPQHLGGLGQGDNVMFEFPGLVIPDAGHRSEEHTSELQSHHDLVCRLLLEKKKNLQKSMRHTQVFLPLIMR